MNSIHHVTAMSGKASRNLDFYTRVLGMRFVKKTVNFDDPGTYHLYYGDEAGHPGTILTYFPWENSAPGVRGVGEAEETWLRIPQASLGFWFHRLIEQNVVHEAISEQFGRKLIRFQDPDGMKFALVATPEAELEEAWTVPGIDEANTIRGVDSVVLRLQEAAPTSRVLTEIFGFQSVASEQGLDRFEIPGYTGPGGAMILHATGDSAKGRLGQGSVHHVAFRAKDDAEQAMLGDRLERELGIHSTPQRDRDYFRSIYFHEPGGVLFEIATDEPGFAVDEPADQLGTSLKLPKQLEPRREALEKVLPSLA
jgi:glyoxalase family protein